MIWILWIFNNSAFADINIPIEEQTKDINFDIWKFKSCEDLNSKVSKYIKEHQYNMPVLYKWWVAPMVQEISTSDAVMSEWSVWSAKASPSSNATKDYTSTNTQEKWVDETDIIKTDWNYIYYYNSKLNNVILFDKDNNVIEKFNLPKESFNTNLYIDDNLLTIITSKYNNTESLINGTYTYVITYDLSDINNIKLLTLNKIQWEYFDSRKVWNNLTLINKVYVNYYSIYESKNDTVFDIKNLNSINIIRDEAATTLINWKKLPYDINLIKEDCSNISYILPETKDISNFWINVIANIDVSWKKETNQKIIFWNIDTIYMNQNSLYLTSNIYFNQWYSCGMWRMCIMPYYNIWNNTLLYKFNILDNNIEYNNYAIINWSPLNQYSMYDNWDNFHIVTTWYNDWNNTTINNDTNTKMAMIAPIRNNKSTNLYILDKDLKLSWKLENIAPWEDFKSSRFFNDNRLALVTFEQIDPLFLIDIKDKTKPKIEWELKIPWFSTYLHPIDENHLLWLWVDTKENQWGWTSQAWIKLDIYDISDIKNPKQKYTYSMWWSGSYSEALNNPKMFIFDKDKNLLSLPVTLMDYQNPKYKSFNGIELLNIDINKGISEKNKLTHINSESVNAELLKQCNEVILNIEKTNNKPVKLINWKEYLINNNYVYIPEYCIYWNDNSNFLNQNIYMFNDYLIQRSVIIWDNVYALSNNKISKIDINTNKDITNEYK